MDTDFTLRFGWFVAHVALAAAIGGGLGVGLASLLQRSNRLAQSCILFLRLGHWLPFFVLWGLPSWKPGTAQVTNLSALVGITWETIDVVPMIVFSSCYFRLSFAMSAPSELLKNTFPTLKAVFLHSLLICILWQIWVPGWPWRWFALTPSIMIGVIVLFLLAALAWLINLWTRMSWQDDLDARRVMVLWQTNRFTTNTFGGAALIAIAYVYGLLFTGAKAFPEAGTTIGYDIYASLTEVVAGFALAGIVGVAFIQIRAAGERVSQILDKTAALSSIAPIGLWMSCIVTIPGFISFWSKATIAGCLAFYPLVSSLQSLEDMPTSRRWLLAIEQALPFAFVGMIFGEMWGGTRGLSFLMVSAGASLRANDALAVSLVTFGVLVLISFAIRIFVNRLYAPVGV
jgi:ABC-type nitrate/sulfonate/bicarbonate transport system permease component